MRTKNVEDAQLDFLVSALSHGSFKPTEEILAWMKQQNDEVVSKIKQIPLTELDGWSYRDDRIRHISGKFFSIDGIHIETNYRDVAQWDQPIINQPEIGFLGFIVKKFNGVLHFLMQAKIEPGNLNVVQLSPTLQATRSNYTRVHGGKSPTYLEYFNGEKDVTVLVDQLQSEQGARFLHKRNRNIIVEVDENEELEVKPNFLWVSLGQIKELLRYPNVVNMDSRTVISCIKFGSYSEHSLKLMDRVKRMAGVHSSKPDSFLYSVLSADNHLHELQDIIQWITALKFKYELGVTPIGISNMQHWIYDGNTIHHEDNKYFDVIGVRVEIGNREVVSWDQPMVRSAQEGLMGFVVKKINGIYHFLVQAKLESGNFDVVEMAPTVQCLTGNYRKGENEYTIPYLETFLEAPKDKIWYSSYQSEEGGRFFQEQNLNIIVEVGNEFSVEVEENYCWMTLNQMLSFVTYNNYLNIAARSLLSAIRIGIICPSEIAFRRFMPALQKTSDKIQFAGIAYSSPEEWFGDTSKVSPEAINEQQERESNKAQTFIDAFGGKIYKGYQTLIESKDIDAIYLPLPPALHFKWAKMALENGKHVFVEKPSTTCLADTDELIKIASERGLALHENYMFIFHDQLKAIDDVVASGEIGNVRLYRISFGFPRRAQNDFRYNKLLGGGALLDAGGYTMKYAGYLLGDTAKVVTAQVNYLPEFDVEMYGSATMINAKGVTAQLAFGMDNDYKCDIEIWGSQGTITSNRILTAPAGFVPSYTIKKNQNIETRELPADDAFLKSIMRFCKCIEDGNARKDNYQILLQQERHVEDFKQICRM